VPDEFDVVDLGVDELGDGDPARGDGDVRSREDGTTSSPMKKANAAAVIPYRSPISVTVACRRRSRSWLTSFMCRLMSSPSRRGLPPIRRPTRYISPNFWMRYDLVSAAK
jgi:hypothetical protein